MPLRPSPSGLKKLTQAVATLLAATTLLPSCAYMQTHKNVREWGRSYHGHKLEKPTRLYRSGNSWYIAATPATYGLSHDVLHDNVFYKTNEPTMKLREEQTGTTAYHRLSASTATILLRSDGYADTETLARELAQSPEPWLDSLPHATTRPVVAELAGPDSAAVTGSPSPAQVPLSYKLLGNLDFVLIDVPGTVAYNVAVPVIVPFVFFYQFLNED